VAYSHVRGLRTNTYDWSHLNGSVRHSAEYVVCSRRVAMPLHIMGSVGRIRPYTGDDFLGRIRFYWTTELKQNESGLKNVIGIPVYITSPLLVGFSAHHSAQKMRAVHVSETVLLQTTLWHTLHISNCGNLRSKFCTLLIFTRHAAWLANIICLIILTWQDEGTAMCSSELPAGVKSCFTAMSDSLFSVLSELSQHWEDEDIIRFQQTRHYTELTR
jgi:hypothetical protein